MAATIDNINLPADTWVDLYETTGIAVGTQLNVRILGGSQVWLVASATPPLSPPKGYRNYTAGDEIVNDISDPGAWALSRIDDGLINVKVA